mmetsp:Transcript_466/g.822  ORF Transcript_466/g.822 Transcript_466/m.822 type:complete len:220 (-) Transcript_466:76-735(-)
MLSGMAVQADGAGGYRGVDQAHDHPVRVRLEHWPQQHLAAVLHTRAEPAHPLVRAGGGGDRVVFHRGQVLFLPEAAHPWNPRPRHPSRRLSFARLRAGGVLVVRCVGRGSYVPDRPHRLLRRGAEGHAARVRHLSLHCPSVDHPPPSPCVHIGRPRGDVQGMGEARHGDDSGVAALRGLHRVFLQYHNHPPHQVHVVRVLFGGRGVQGVPRHRLLIHRV